MSQRQSTEPADQTLLSIFLRFLRFGLLAWGGPVAQIAMVKRELVEQERWLSPTRFNRLLAVYQVLPGPEAHELCVHLGIMKRGRLGGLLAGLGFMLPGLVLILAIAFFYGRLDLQEPLIAALFLGAQIGVVALIFRAVHRIADHALGSSWLWGVAIVSAVATAFGSSFWIVLPAAGAATAAIAARRPSIAVLVAALALTLAAVVGVAAPDGAAGEAAAHPIQQQGPVEAWVLFLTGLKAGLLTFGGAYTAIPFVREDAVGRGWVSEGEFLDGIALSGIIPAPLIIFATFVGYLAGGLAGAIAMTAGIFLPAFAFGMLFYDRLERVMEDERLHAFLEGVTAGVVGLITFTALELAQHLWVSAPNLVVAAGVFLASLAVLYVWTSRLNVPVVVLGSALVGVIAFG